MTKVYIKKDSQKVRRIIRMGGLFLCLFGLVFMLYFSFPLISFQLYLQPVFASQGVMSPIPKTTVLNENSIQTLLKATTDRISGVDYNNAQNWFPTFQEVKTTASVTHYSLSIPKLDIIDAYVTTIDNDLSSHLVHYPGTAVPPNKGNAVIFGHSTLPQLYNPSDYKTIFAYAHTLKTGDTLEVTVDGKKIVYTIDNITITSPQDTAFFAQNFDGNYLTIVTCTPPGTTWKRLIIKAKAL